MSEFFNLVSPEEARAQILGAIDPLGEFEIIPTENAIGRVTVNDITAPQVLPEFRRSTVDGYAVVAQDTFGASESLPTYLNLVGEVLTGEVANLTIQPGDTAIVHTGGMIPDGADAVVMVENAQMVGEAEVEIRGPVATGENVIQVGEDISSGDLIIPAGHRLRVQDIGGLLAVGIVAVKVARQPRLAIYSTGNEVIPPDRRTRIGQVRDINSYTISALAEQAGAIVNRGGILPDDWDVLRRESQRALDAGADMLVISAGSSVSVRDLTSDVFNSLGQPGVLVHGVATRPGKPTILAVAGGKPLMGLPGNPVSAFVQFMMIGVPVIYRLMGADTPRMAAIRVKLTTNVASAAGREDFIPTRLVEQKGEVWADPIFFKSNLIFTLVHADGLLKVPLDKTGLEAGEPVEVRLF